MVPAVQTGSRLPVWRWAAAAATVAALVLVALRVVNWWPVGGVVAPTATPGPSSSAADAPEPSAPKDPLDFAERRFVDDVISAGTLRVPTEVRALQGGVGALLGRRKPGATPAQPLSPSATAVESARPQFTWPAVPGAVSYVVAVFDDGFREVASSGALRDRAWTPGADLPRGVQLAWQVTATLPGGRTVLAPVPPQPEARFIVIPEVLAIAVKRQRERIVDHPLELAILLARAGLVDAAAAELKKAEADTSTVDRARALLATLRK